MKKKTNNHKTIHFYFFNLSLALYKIRIFYPSLILLLLVFHNSNAQLWTQLGAGAGGQVRALYVDKVGVNYDVYVGSDVSGLWKAEAISDLNDQSIYSANKYKYISNHEIMRFINKIYYPQSYQAAHLFVGSQSGIHTVQKGVTAPAMQNIYPMEDGWVSDIYISQQNVSGTHNIYFITGNTRVGDDDPDDAKVNQDDFFWGELTTAEDAINNVNSVKLPGMPANLRGDVYCMLMDEQFDTDFSNDTVYVGSETGLYVFTIQDAITYSGSMLLSGTLKPNPDGNNSAYQVTSITRVQGSDILLVTIYGLGVFQYDTHNQAGWVGSYPGNNLIGALKARKYGDDNIVNDVKADVNSFTQLKPLTDNSGNTNGYLLFNEDPSTDVGGINYFAGVFYSTASAPDYLPSTDWLALTTATGNAWGWNATKPCSNINSNWIVNEPGTSNNNLLLIGKQGNLFVTQDTIAGPGTANWQQIYTDEQTVTCPPNSSMKYKHMGYVNTAAQAIFWEGPNSLWYSERDRQLSFSDDNGAYSMQLTMYSDCKNINLGTPANACSLTAADPYKLSDCLFITNNTIDNTDTKLYAGIAEGYGGNKGRGMVMTLDNNSDTWNLFADAKCFDPKKLLFSSNNDKYLFATGDDGDVIYYLNNNQWQVLTLFTSGVDEIDDAVMSPDGNNLFVIRKNENIYWFTKSSQSSWTQAGSIATDANVANKKLAVLQFENNTRYKILCGSHPRNYTSTYENFYEVYESGSGMVQNAITSNCAATCNFAGTDIFNQLLRKDKIDAVITAIEINHDLSSIYVGTVSIISGEVKSHLYRGTFNAVTGVIDNCWNEITGDNYTTGMPNKSVQFITSRGSTFTDERLFACVRGLGEWKNDIDVFRLEVTKTNVSCLGGSDGAATVTGYGGVPPYTFDWGAYGTSSTITGLTIGTYTVTITDDNGCSLVQSVLVSNASTSCCGNMPNTIADQNDFDLLGSTINDDYNLNHDVFFNVSISNSFIIDASNFSIAEGVSITIPDQVTVTINNSSVFTACGNMWKGFIVEAGGTLIINSSIPNPNTLIEHAQYGIHVLANGNLFCYGATLEHNYVDIFVPDLQNGTVIVEGTTFSCAGCTTGNPLRGAYPGQSPSPNTITFAGIEAYNSTFNIGVSGGVPNHFIELYRGTTLEDCYNVVLNSDFNTMISTVYYMPLGGFGIYADMNTGGFLKQVGLGEYAPTATFDNCRTAIYSTGGSFSASDNKMLNVTNGIRVSDVTAQNISITANHIEAASTGISALSNEYAANVDIAYNTVTVNGATAAGIGVFETNVSSSSRIFKIRCNTLNVDNGLFGIHVNSTTRINILQNSVSLNTNGNTATGIGLSGSSFCSVIENNVTGNNVSRHTAFRANLSESNQIINNNANLTLIGFDFWDGCDYTTFKGNSMGDHEVGLLLNSSGVIGPQTQAGNMWTGSFTSTYGAQNFNATTAGVTASQFEVHVATQGLYRPNYLAPNENIFDPWFKFNPSGTPVPISFPNVCISYILNDEEENLAMLLDTLIASDSINAIEYSDELKYKCSRSLQSKLMRSDSMRADNGLFENYYDLLLSTTSHSLTLIENKLTSDLTFLSTVSIQDSIISIKLDSIRLTDSLLSVSFSQSVLQIRQSILAQIKNTDLYIRNLKLNNELLIDSICLILKTENQNLTASNNIEHTEIEVNNLLLSIYGDDVVNADSTTIDTYLNIAKLCPFEFGKSVFKIRSRLAVLGYDTLFYDDRATCMQYGFYRLSEKSGNLRRSTEFMILPNPATDDVSFCFSDDCEPNSFICISDLTGKTIQKLIINKGSKQIGYNTSMLCPGIYSVTYKNPDGFYLTNKLVIFR